MERPYDHLLKLYSNALFRLNQCKDIDLPIAIELWLTIMSHVVAHQDHSPADWQSVWLDKAILRANITLWPQASELLRSIAWVDFIHDRRGKQAFEAALLRIKRAACFHVSELS